MKIRVDVNQVPSAHLTFKEHQYVFQYIGLESVEVSLALPVRKEPYLFHTFPAQFDALLPRRWHKELLSLKDNKLEQLAAIGQSVPGNLSFLKV